MKTLISALMFAMCASISGVEVMHADTPQTGLKRGMELPAARRIILSKGWQPVRYAEEYDGTQIMLIRHGYKEANGCSMGLTFCSFFYKKGDGSCLKMTTQGEQITTMTVQNWEPTCQADDQ